jgi:hypothetical protein
MDERLGNALGFRYTTADSRGPGEEFFWQQMDGQNGAPMTAEQRQRSDFRSNLRALLRSNPNEGQQQLNQAVRDGRITPIQSRNILKESQGQNGWLGMLSAPSYGGDRASAPERIESALQVWDHADKIERQQMLPIIQHKIDGSKKLTYQQRNEYLQHLNAVR